jgi:hypothetical protein
MSAERRAQAERSESGEGVASCLVRGIVVRGRRGYADAALAPLEIWTRARVRDG